MTKSKASLMTKRKDAGRKTRSTTRRGEIEGKEMNWRHLIGQADTDDSDMQEGEYFVIRFEPELTGEIINIGVCLRGSDGIFYIKTIKDFTILNQIWKGFEEQTKFAVLITGKMLMKDGYPNSPSYQISYSKLRSSRYNDVRDCLDDLYKSFITHDPSIKRGE